MSLEGNDRPPGIGNSSHKCRVFSVTAGLWPLDLLVLSESCLRQQEVHRIFGLLLVTYWNLLTTLSSSRDLQGLPVRPPHPQVSETCALGMEPSPSAPPGLGRQGVRLSLVLLVHDGEPAIWSEGSWLRSNNLLRVPLGNCELSLKAGLNLSYALCTGIHDDERE